jgi:hypothetical protein
MSDIAEDQVDVFLSYASARRSAVEHFAHVLESFGYNVWYDYKLVAGHDYNVQIDRKIRSAKAVIVLWCPLSVQSRWVNSEADLALAREAGASAWLVASALHDLKLPRLSV